MTNTFSRAAAIVVFGAGLLFSPGIALADDATGADPSSRGAPLQRAEAGSGEGATQGQTKEHILLKDGKGEDPKPRAVFVKMGDIKGESTGAKPAEDENPHAASGPKEKFPPTKKPVGKPTGPDKPTKPGAGKPTGPQNFTHNVGGTEYKCKSEWVDHGNGTGHSEKTCFCKGVQDCIALETDDACSDSVHDDGGGNGHCTWRD